MLSVMPSDYLELLKLVLTGFIYPESSNQPVRAGKNVLHRALINLLRKYRLALVRLHPFDPEKRKIGRDWPGLAYTMVGIKRLDNVQFAIETVLAENIPGDVVECGVWRGGCAVFMRA